MNTLTSRPRLYPRPCAFTTLPPPTPPTPPHTPRNKYTHPPTATHNTHARPGAGSAAPLERLEQAQSAALGFAQGLQQVRFCLT